MIDDRREPAPRTDPEPDTGNTAGAMFSQVTEMNVIATIGHSFGGTLTNY